MLSAFDSGWGGERCTVSPWCGGRLRLKVFALYWEAVGKLIQREREFPLPEPRGPLPIVVNSIGSSTLISGCCPIRSRAKRDQHKRCQGSSPCSPDQNLVMTVLFAPRSLDNGLPKRVIFGNYALKRLDSFRALSGRLKYTVRRHKSNHDSLS